MLSTLARIKALISQIQVMAKYGEVENQCF